MARLGRAKIFAKLDANSGFYQCVLDKESAPMTIFITPYERYIYRRVPMIYLQPQNFIPLKWLEEAGVILNATFSYLGFIIDGEEIRPDPKKVKAMQDYPQPSSLTEARHFLGMINQLTKFLNSISEVSTPLCKFFGKETRKIYQRLIIKTNMKNKNKNKKQIWNQRQPAVITSTTTCATATPIMERQNPTQEGVHCIKRNNKDVLPERYCLN